MRAINKGHSATALEGLVQRRLCRGHWSLGLLGRRRLLQAEHVAEEREERQLPRELELVQFLAGRTVANAGDDTAYKQGGACACSGRRTT